MLLSTLTCWSEEILKSTCHMYFSTLTCVGTSTCNGIFFWGSTCTFTWVFILLYVLVKDKNSVCVVPVGLHWSWTRLAVTPQRQKDPQTCVLIPPWGRTDNAAPAWRLYSSCPVDTNSELNKTNPFTQDIVVMLIKNIPVWMNENMLNKACLVKMVVADCLKKNKNYWGQKFTHWMALTLLQYSLRQMVVENQSPEHRQVKQWLQQQNSTMSTMWYCNKGQI